MTFPLEGAFPKPPATTPGAPRKHIFVAETPPFPPIGPVNAVFCRILKATRTRGLAPPPTRVPTAGRQLSTPLAHCETVICVPFTRGLVVTAFAPAVIPDDF